MNRERVLTVTTTTASRSKMRAEISEIEGCHAEHRDVERARAVVLAHALRRIADDVEASGAMPEWTRLVLRYAHY